MKKLKSLLVILLIMMIAFPFSVKAKENPEKGKEPVKVYFFHGSTCGYCQAAFKWFETIEKEYGDYYDIVDYEVWGNTENQELMEEVASIMGDTASGVPYIIVGDYSYPNGFASDTIVDEKTKKTMGDELIEQILEVYESDNRYDVMTKIKEKPDYSNVVGIVAGVIIVGLVAVAVISRKQNS